MIGIFDSGSGWLTFLVAMRRKFPEYGYLYFGDYANCPYGNKSPEEIQELTIAGVKKLFDAGATIVVLACNTASAWTLRKLQTEIFPGRRILGVTIPGAEKVVELGLWQVTVFATEQTVKSRTYAERVNILNRDVSVTEIALDGGLVTSIEALLPVQRCHTEEDFGKLMELHSFDGWNCTSPEWGLLTRKYFEPYVHNSSESIVLGCTHYSYFRKPLQKLFPNTVIIDPSEESAEKFENYSLAHPEAISGMQRTGRVVFL